MLEGPIDDDPPAKRLRAALPDPPPAQLRSIRAAPLGDLPDYFLNLVVDLIYLDIFYQLLDL